jgi:hypothetical protein
MRRLGLVALAVLAFAGCATARPVLTVAPGLHPRMSPADAEAVAREAIDGQIALVFGRREPPDAVALTAIRGGATVAGYLAGTSWIIEFEGAFAVREGGRRVTERTVGRAWVQVSDDDGAVLAVNFGD